MQDILNYIKPELLLLIPVLYFIGIALKKSKLRDTLIPLVLGLCGVALVMLWVLATSEIDGWQRLLLAVFTAVVQGILIAGCSVYANQLYKQLKADNEATKVTDVYKSGAYIIKESTDTPNVVGAAADDPPESQK